MRWTAKALVFVLLAWAGPCAVASAAIATPAPSKPIAGYLDPATHVFTPLPPSPAQAAAAAPVRISGRLIIRANVAISPSIPQSAAITAGGRFFFSDATYTSSAARQVNVTRSGNSALVTISFHYKLTARSRSVPMKVTLFVRSSSTGIPFFQASQNIPLPADGSTTTVSFPGAF